MASGASVGKTRGTRSTDCDLLLAWASLSGVPSGAWRFTAEPEVSICSTLTNFRNPFSKSLVKSCHPAFLSFASATVVALLYFLIAIPRFGARCFWILLLVCYHGPWVLQGLNLFLWKRHCVAGKPQRERSENAKGKKYLSKKYLSQPGHALRTGQIPTSWQTTIFKMLLISSGAKFASDFRPLVGCVCCTLFSRYPLLGRMEDILEDSQPGEQHSFRKQSGIEEHLLAANLCCRQNWRQTSRCGSLVWMFWAFDNVNWESLWAAFGSRFAPGANSCLKRAGTQGKKTELAEQYGAHEPKPSDCKHAVSNGVWSKLFRSKFRLAHRMACSPEGFCSSSTRRDDSLRNLCMYYHILSLSKKMFCFCSRRLRMCSETWAKSKLSSVE